MAHEAPRLLRSAGLRSGTALTLFSPLAIGVVYRMVDDFAGDVAVADARRHLRALPRQVLTDLREPERLAAQVRGDDRLSHEPHVLAGHGQGRATRVVAPRLEHDARQP